MLKLSTTATFQNNGHHFPSRHESDPYILHCMKLNNDHSMFIYLRAFTSKWIAGSPLRTITLSLTVLPPSTAWTLFLTKPAGKSWGTVTKPIYRRTRGVVLTCAVLLAAKTILPFLTEIFTPAKNGRKHWFHGTTVKLMNIRIEHTLSLCNQACTRTRQSRDHTWHRACSWSISERTCSRTFPHDTSGCIYRPVCEIYVVNVKFLLVLVRSTIVKRLVTSYSHISRLVRTQHHFA